MSASGAGDPKIEHEIFTTIALPGRQLGKLTDVVTTLLELTERTHTDLDKIIEPEQAIAITEFKQMVADIRSRKDAIKQSAEDTAEIALLRLKNVDANAFRRLIEKEYEDERANRSNENQPQ